MKKKPSEIIKEMQDLFRSRKRWVAGHFAVKKNGCSTKPINADACAWCFEGALEKCSFKSGNYAKTYDLIEEVTAKKYSNTMIGVNDEEGFTAVKDCLKDAKKLAISRGL